MVTAAFMSLLGLNATQSPRSALKIHSAMPRAGSPAVILAFHDFDCTVLCELTAQLLAGTGIAFLGYACHTAVGGLSYQEDRYVAVSEFLIVGL